MILKKNDFIEIEFTGKIEDGDIFDSNIPENLSKLNPNAKAKPFIFPLGHKMFLEAIDEFLIGKETGKKYSISLTPEKAFGKRNSSLIKLIPMTLFKQQQTQPVPGMVFNFDNQLGKVVSVSGGRVLVDFNHPLAGKNVVYEINVLKKISNTEEKIKALNDFFFRKELNFSIEEKSKILIIKSDKSMKDYILLFKDKFREILGFELKVEEERKDNSRKENK